MPRHRRMLTVNAVLAVTVLAAWVLVGGDRAFEALGEHWRVALTMVFGSLVGGGTSEGGGAVGFPMLTKVLGVPAADARLFTFAIQSVGMTAASISILLSGARIERRAIVHGAPPAVLGGVLGVVVLAPHLPLHHIRLGFTAILTSLGIALLVSHARGSRRRHDAIPVFGTRERVVVGAAGLLGGMLSGVAGVGENTLMFIVLVLLFGVCEKVSTPTTVVLMTIVSCACFLTHVLVVRDFAEPVVGYWLAATPVVAIGAPLGAFVCTLITRGAVRAVLWVLITVELVSTLVIVPMTWTEQAFFWSALAVAVVGCTALTRVRTYRAALDERSDPAPAGPPGGGRERTPVGAGPDR